MNKRPLVIAVAGAAATLVVVALLLGVPAADRCAPTGRTLWDCVRDGFSERYLHRETARVPAQQIPATPDVPVDLLANEPDRPPVTFELADVSDDAAIIAQDLPAPVSLPAAEHPTAPPADIAVPAREAEAPPVERPAPAVPPPPGIDTIAFDGSGLVAGTGPKGATIRLYLDGELAGETSVEDGRWAIEDVDLGAALTQELRVEAIEPATGKVLGSSAFTIEIDLPDDPPNEPEPERLLPDPAPSASPVVEPDPPAALPVRRLVPPDLIADTSPDAFPTELLTREVPQARDTPAAPARVDLTATPADLPGTAPDEAAADEGAAVAEPAAAAPVVKPATAKPPKVAKPKKKRALPPLRPVKPRKASPSVTILDGGSGGSITTLGN
jgi:hypothetical protein